MRPKTPLNIPRQPTLGSTWIIKNISTNALFKCSITSHSDLSHIPKLRQFSGPNPFFTCKLGSKRTHITFLTFFCSPSSPLSDSSNQWLWLNLTQKEANSDQLWYSEPNLVSHILNNPIQESDFITI